ncbi:MAG: hypothetical protein OEZ29_03125 [Candidatus Bathyarchaeota archaeon]|nr:hypothetical protein [Candidatus Bathyarchaeota archaeon]
MRLEKQGYSQISIIDYSELYRYMHPQYVRIDKRENLVITHLMLSKPGLVHSDFYLIPPYYYEFLSHLKRISSTMQRPIFDDLLETPEIKEFIEIMGSSELDPNQVARLNKLGDFLIANFLDLLLRDAADASLTKPIETFLNLIVNDNLKIWTELEDPEVKDISFLDLAKNMVYLGMRDRLDDISEQMGHPKRTRVANRIDALAAAFVHEANSRLFKKRKYTVLVTGSGIPFSVCEKFPATVGGLRIPLARDLYYVQSRIYFFEKYVTIERILELLDRILPPMGDFVKKSRPLIDHLRFVSDFQHIPSSIGQIAQEIFPSWEILREILLDDMARILGALLLDVLTDDRRQIIRETPALDENLYKKIYRVLSDEKVRTASARETLEAVTDVISRIQSTVGRSYGEVSKMVAAVRLSKEVEKEIDDFAAEYRTILLEYAGEIARKKNRETIIEQDVREALIKLWTRGKL